LPCVKNTNVTAMGDLVTVEKFNWGSVGTIHINGILTVQLVFVIYSTTISVRKNSSREFSNYASRAEPTIR
jgi:hypothetical protein